MPKKKKATEAKPKTDKVESHPKAHIDTTAKNPSRQVSKTIEPVPTKQEQAEHDAREKRRKETAYKPKHWRDLPTQPPAETLKRPKSSEE